MIRSIAAIDADRGFANDKGIPWAGKIPADSSYFLQHIAGQEILYGYKTYRSVQKPFSFSTNFVLTHPETELRPGFTAVTNLDQFLADHPNAWMLGGEAVYSRTMDAAEELYITQLQGSYGCTRFFPAFQDDFKLVSESEPQTENGITYTFQVWRQKTSA